MPRTFTVLPNLSSTQERLVRLHAARLCKAPGFNSSDLDDVEQVLNVLLWRMASRYDPSQSSWEKWASVVLKRRCISLRRERWARKRTIERQSVPLSQLIRSGDADTATVRSLEPEARPDRTVDLRHDFHELRVQLNPEQREVLDALGACGGSVLGAAKRLQRPRSQIERVRDSIRERCVDAGLEAYL